MVGSFILLHRLTLEEFYEAWGAKVKEETAGILAYVKVDDAEFCFPSNRKTSRFNWGSNDTSVNFLLSIRNISKKT